MSHFKRTDKASRSVPLSARILGGPGGASSDLPPINPVFDCRARLSATDRGHCWSRRGRATRLDHPDTDGAQVEGNIIAEELTIGGRVKGTIHANRVKLNSRLSLRAKSFIGPWQSGDAQFKGNVATAQEDVIHMSVAVQQTSRRRRPCRWTTTERRRRLPGEQ